MRTTVLYSGSKSVIRAAVGDPDVPGRYTASVCEVDADGGQGNPVAYAIHRTCYGQFPLDGEVAEAALANLVRVARLLNADEDARTAA